MGLLDEILSAIDTSYRQAIAYACMQCWPTPEGLSKSEILDWHRVHKWSPNQLRHSAAGEIRDAFGLEHVAAVLGHADINTSQIHAKLRQEQAIEAALSR